MPGPNPLVALGKLNRLRGSIMIPKFPQLNITASCLGRDGIRMAYEGNLTDMLPQMVGQVQSPSVYLPASLSVQIVKTLPIASAYYQQMLDDCDMGDITFRADASNLPPFEIQNCSIQALEGFDANGTSAAWPIRFGGTWYVNSSLWNLG
jgi:hypothetical protein